MAPAAMECPLAGALAERLRLSCAELTRRWLERITARVAIKPNRIFPTDDLLNHVPLLIGGIADYLENPVAEVSVDMPVVGKAMELGALRHAQGFDAYEILKEYEILGGILFKYLANAADEIDQPCEKSELLICGYRVFHAVAIIQQTTTAHFLRLADGAVAEREGRLRAFNRSVSHEIKNRIATVLGASEVLREIGDMTPERRETFLAMISNNARHMQGSVENLIALSRTEADVRHHRHVRLPEAIVEACRQVREPAQAVGVQIRVSPDLPEVEVNAAAVELCLINYLSNAIKYADRNRADRFAAVSAAIESRADGDVIVVRVTDNGYGVAADKREKLFERFFRAHETVTDAEGTGLGLSIVRETAESVGGRAWAEFPGHGSVFAFSLPFRRKSSGESAT